MFLDVIPHEVAQELRPGAVLALGRRLESIPQGGINADSEINLFFALPYHASYVLKMHYAHTMHNKQEQAAGTRPDGRGPLPPLVTHKAAELSRKSLGTGRLETAPL